MTYTLLDSLPFPRLRKEDPRVATIVSLTARLICTSTEMNPYWDCLAAHGWVPEIQAAGGVPGATHADERREMRAELDAYVAKEVFGLSRNELEYILDTFPIVERKDQEEFGEYRTKRVILEVYDGMARAMQTGHPYQTRLDPPPADPKVAHPSVKQPI